MPLVDTTCCFPLAAWPDGAGCAAWAVCQRPKTVTDPYELLDDGVPGGVVELPPEWIRKQRGGCWFATHEQRARWCRDHA